MTRINVVPVEELTDNFILAEYFELPRIFKLVINHWNKAKGPSDLNIPEKYTLGKGHMSFFYNKLTYLQNRHNELAREGTKRGLTLIIDPAVGDYWFPSTYAGWWNDYVPTPEAIQINRDRLQIRRRYEGGSYVIRRDEGSCPQ